MEEMGLYEFLSETAVVKIGWHDVYLGNNLRVNAT